MRTVFCLILFVISERSFGQDLTTQFIIGTEYNQQDLFVNTGFSKRFSSLEFSANVGVGVNRTIFQQRFFPKLQLQGSYRVLQLKQFKIGPAITLNYSLMKVNLIDNHLAHFSNYGVGYHAEIGTKFQVFQSTYFCRMTEHYYDTFVDHYTTASKWIFSIQIGGRYAF